MLATEPFHDPVIPAIADQIDPDVYQVPSAHYRNPESFPAGPVLVVGAANSGCQIAQEPSATHSVELSTGQRIPTLPQRPLGRDVWWWASHARLDKVTLDSRLGGRLSGRDQRIGSSPWPGATASGSRARVTEAAGRTVTFADGDASEFDAVIWATGYGTDHSWIDIPDAKDEHGRVRHTRGVTPPPGFYVLGLTWQHTRGSALLGWVGADAVFLSAQITRLHQQDQPTRTAATAGDNTVTTD